MVLWLTDSFSDISHVGEGKDDSLKLSWSEFKISKNISIHKYKITTNYPKTNIKVFVSYRF